MLAILLHQRQDTCGNNAVSLAEVVIDLYGVLVGIRTVCLDCYMAFELLVPCSVSVMDCSSFSSSSVSERFLALDGPLRDMLKAMAVPFNNVLCRDWRMKREVHVRVLNALRGSAR